MDVVGMTTAACRWIRGCKLFAGEGARATLAMPPSRKQCSRTRSRAGSGNTERAPVQKVTNTAASAFCKCGSRLRYRYFDSGDALLDMEDRLCGGRRRPSFLQF